MGRPQQIDRGALHRILYRRGTPVANRDNVRRITFKSQDVAGRTGIAIYHFSRILREFRDQGRIAVFKKGKHSITTYDVLDEDAWLNGERLGD